MGPGLTCRCCLRGKHIETSYFQLHPELICCTIEQRHHALVSRCGPIPFTIVNEDRLFPSNRFDVLSRRGFLRSRMLVRSRRRVPPNRLTSAEDNEEALLSGYPPVGLLDAKRIEQTEEKRKGSLIFPA